MTNFIQRIAARLRAAPARDPGSAASPSPPPPAPPAAPEPVPPPVDPVRERYITRKGFIITDLVSAALPPDERFVILDGGAREAHADPRWSTLDPRRTVLYGFEPDAKEVDDLNKGSKERGLDFQYFAGALWGDTRAVTFYENKSPGGGSCFPQNRTITDRWKFENHQDLFLSRDIFYPTAEALWNTTSLNEWAKSGDRRGIDFMKLNVQGAELEILNGSTDLLDGVIGIMTEVSFVESYRDRPFFSDIDAFLRRHNFAFFDLIGLHYIGRADSVITARHHGGLYPLWGQLIEAHGVYFRDPIDMQARGVPIDHLSKEKLLKLVCFAELFGQIEYAFELLVWTEKLLRQRNDVSGANEVAGLAGQAEANYRRYTV